MVLVSYARILFVIVLIDADAFLRLLKDIMKVCEFLMMLLWKKH
jgi:hypothetical protein